MVQVATEAMFWSFAAKKGFLAALLLWILFGATHANTTTLTVDQPQSIKFKTNTSFILSPDSSNRFLRVKDTLQTTFIEIHNKPSEYFFDSYYDFTHYDTLIPPHSDPLKITIHTFVQNDLPNQAKVSLSRSIHLNVNEQNGHKALKLGFSKIIKNYLKQSTDESWVKQFKTAHQYFKQARNHLWAGIAANHWATEESSFDNLDKSIQVFQIAIDHFIKGSNPAYRWYSENLLGLREWRLNQIDTAKKRFKSITLKAEQLGLTKLAKSGYNNLGLMEWESRNVYSAISAFEKGLALFGITEQHLLQQNVAITDRKAIPTISNLARAYASLGQLDKAKRINQLALNISEHINYKLSASRSLINIGNILIQQSQFDEALKNLNKANEESYKNSLKTWWKIKLHFETAVTYQNLSLYSLASNHYLKAFALADAQNFTKQRIDILLGLYQLNPQDDDANQWINEAKKLSKGKHFFSQQAIILRILAEQEFTQNNHTLAVKYLLESITTLKGKYKHESQTLNYLALAKLYQSQEHHTKAINTLIEANKALPLSSSKLLFNQILNALAYNQWKVGKKSEALITIKKSIDKLYELSQHISHSKTQQQLKLQVDETLALYSMLFAKEQNPAKTVAFINKTQRAWQSASSKNQKDQAADLFNQIANISFALENNRLSDQTRETMEREIISLNNQLDYLSTINKNEIPDIDIIAMQAAMSKDELTIKFMTGQYGSIAWWISKDKIICVPLEKRENLSQKIEHTRQTIADQAKLTPDIIELTEHLFSPLKDYPEVHQLNLILDEPLNVLPIAALPLLETFDPMVDRYVIKSLSNLPLEQNNNVTQTWQPVYFANPVHHHKDPRLPEGVSADGITEFTPLSGSAHEVKAINTILPGNVFQGFNANKNNFKNHNNQANVLHMATHAFFNEDRPDLSALVLSTYDEQGKNQASMVRASEIRNMDMPHDLVVLSGCETGLSSGNGLTGLTQSFLQAGAQNIISSLWQVDDRATSMMMTLLYKNLNNGQSIEAALRNAQIEIKSQHLTRHPKYWSGWVHISQ